MNEDLSNLREVYEWAEQHPKKVHHIREAGFKICYETESYDAVMTYEMNIIQSLPSTSSEIIAEMKLLREGVLSFSNMNE